MIQWLTNAFRVKTEQESLLWPSSLWSYHLLTFYHTYSLQCLQVGSWTCTHCSFYLEGPFSLLEVIPFTSLKFHLVTEILTSQLTTIGPPAMTFPAILISKQLSLSIILYILIIYLAYFISPTFAYKHCKRKGLWEGLVESIPRTGEGVGSLQLPWASS